MTKHACMNSVTIICTSDTSFSMNLLFYLKCFEHGRVTLKERRSLIIKKKIEVRAFRTSLDTLDEEKLPQINP